MSSPQNRRPPLEVNERAICMCTHGGTCSQFAPGHALHLIQARLAATTPSEWVDAVVEETQPALGELTLRTLEGERIVLWHAGDASANAVVGEPVALHGRYRVLALAGRTFNVARLD